MVSASLRRRELIPHAILLAGLIVTAAAARYAHVTGALEDRLRFENDGNTVLAAIANRLDSYVALLLGGAGLFAASNDVNRDEFRSYVQRLDVQSRYPGIQGIGFSRRIRADERADLLAAIRRELPAFRFWPPRDTAEFTAIVYLEPDDERNRLALGYDMATEQQRALAMARARDLGAPAATAKVRLVQEGENAVNPQSGFLIYVPVYTEGTVPASMDQRRRALLGYVYSPFRAADLLEAVLRQAPTLARFEVFDGGVMDEASLIYRSQAEPAPARFEMVKTTDVAGRSWTVRLYADEAMRTSANRTLVALISAGGIALSGLLFAVMRGQVRARTAAERTSDELRRSEERLRVADRAKDEFLATVSHELRTPLNAIIGWASMLSRGALPRDMYAHAITVIARNASAQARLVEDLLDMSRVVGGHLRLQLADADVAAIIAAAMEGFRPAAEEAGLTIVFEPIARLGTIEADPGRLQQIVGNLLSNAVKFTPRGGRITLSGERRGTMVVITVTDTGVGMEPDFVPFVFERFRQADSSTTRVHAGAGLGLAIARHLVELHGGSIEAASEGPGRGSTFTVRLPVRQLQGRRQEPPVRTQEQRIS